MKTWTILHHQPPSTTKIFSHRTRMSFSHNHVRILPSLQNTFSAYAATLSKVSRLQVQLENKKGAPLPYRDVLHLDASFRSHLETLPPFFRVDWTSETLAQERPVLKHKYGAGSIALQRAILNDQTFFRMLRLHRFYLGKGIKHTHFRRSTVACVEAARGFLLRESNWKSRAITFEAPFSSRVT